MYVCSGGECVGWGGGVVRTCGGADLVNLDFLSLFILVNERERHDDTRVLIHLQ